MKNSERCVQPRGETIAHWQGRGVRCGVCVLCLAAFLLPKHAVNAVFLSEFRLDKFFKVGQMHT